MAESGRELAMKTTPIESDYIIDWNKKLGSGISGPVRMCSNRNTGECYALKILLDSSKAKTEASVHYKCSGHAHIVSVVDVYVNSICFPGELRGQTRIMMVMELMQGGELFDLIRTKRRFTEQEAITFTSQIASAVYHCHSFNVAHRDLKPENLLLKDKSENLVIKLADFGFAKIDRGDLVTPQFTPYYVSPQVLEAQRIHRAQKSGRFPYLTKPYTYDKSCDMWSLGVIIYIMLCGYPPFYSEVPRKQLSQGMRRKIMAGDYDFPEHEWSKISPEAKDLITRLLRVEPAQRITVAEVLDHPWLRGEEPGVEINLYSPSIMADEEAFREAMTAHSTHLTNMRMPDKVVTLKEIKKVRNPILEKRKQMLKLGTLNQNVPPQRPRSNSQAEKAEAVKTLRDVIAFCLMPPIPTSEEYCAEEELGSLVTKALQSNPDSQELKEALIKESWNGEAFLGSVDKRRLAKAVSDVVKKR